MRTYNQLGAVLAVVQQDLQLPTKFGPILLQDRKIPQEVHHDLRLQLVHHDLRLQLVHHDLHLDQAEVVLDDLAAVHLSHRRLYPQYQFNQPSRKKRC